MRALIVDDHSLFSDGLRLLLLGSSACDEVVCSASGPAALLLLARQAFDLVLLDWNLGSGLSGEPLIAEIKAASPGARVVIVSGECAPELIRRAIDSGAVGFVPKDSSPALLIDALTITAHGGIYLPRSVLAGGAGPTASFGASKPADLRSVSAVFPHLTPRHIDVLGYVVKGMSNKEIARHLRITDGTVKQHLNVIFRELDVQNRTEAVYLLAKNGIRFD